MGTQSDAVQGILQLEHAGAKNGVYKKNAVRKRVSKACDRCRKRKIKCGDIDAATGKCSNCLKYNVACTFHYHEQLMQSMSSKHGAAAWKNPAAQAPHLKNEAGASCCHEVHDDSIHGMYIEDPNLTPVSSDHSVHQQLGMGTAYVPRIGNGVGTNDVYQHRGTHVPHMMTQTLPDSISIQQRSDSMVHGMYNALAQAHVPEQPHYAQMQQQIPYPNEGPVDPVQGFPMPVSFSVPENIGMTQQMLSLSEKVDLLGEKLTLIAGNQGNPSWNNRKLATNGAATEKTGQSLVGCAKTRKGDVYAVPKRYRACQYTPLTLTYIKDKVCPHLTEKEFVRPLSYVKHKASQWHYIQMSRLIYSTPSESELLPLPEYSRCQRIMEAYYNLLISEDMNIIEPAVCRKIIEKYFTSPTEDISFSEHMIVNVLLCLGSLFSRHSLKESNHYRKDKLDFTPEQLFEVENSCYKNCLFYYHKMSLVCDGLRSIQGLLLFYNYIKLSFSAEAALSVFVLAVHFARNIELSCLDNFEHLPREEFLQIRSIWLYCYLTDSALSMTLSKPPIIHESEMSVSLGRNYFRTLRAECEISRCPDVEVLEAMKDENLVLQWIKKNPWYFSVMLNYYGSCLAKICNKMSRYLLSVDATNMLTFDEIVAKIIEIKDDLVDFSNTFPIYLRQDNQRTFLARIYHELAESQTIVNFKLMSVLITEHHVKRENLFIILCTFTQSFFNDNRQTIINDNRTDCEDLMKFFESAKLQSYMKTLNACKAIDFKDLTILYHKQSFLHDFFSVMISASFYVITNVNTSASFELLCLLKDVYIRLTSSVLSTEIYVHQDIKWLIFIFLLSFQMEVATIHYRNKSSLSQSYPMEDDRYKTVMKEISNAVSRETEQVSSIFRKENKLKKISKQRCNMQPWALLKPFGDIEAGDTTDNIESWLESIVSLSSFRDPKRTPSHSKDYTLGFNMAEKWPANDMRYFNQESFLKPQTQNLTDDGLPPPTSFFEDIQSLDR